MPRILIVDDNQKNLYLLEAILKGNGYEVIAATNGAEALAAAKDDPPDAVITDILMPVMDGFELCRRWKADEQLNGIPVIFYTATYTDQKDQEFAQKIGVDRFIIKPQKPEVLASEIKRILDERQEKGTVQTSWHVSMSGKPCRNIARFCSTNSSRKSCSWKRRLTSGRPWKKNARH